MLEAVEEEKLHPDVAIFKYQYVIGNAKTDRDLSFVIPAYLRLTDLLEQHGRYKDATEFIERFEQTYAPGKLTGHYSPTDSQRAAITERRKRVMAISA
jgi:hypothetical protein